MVFCIGTFKYSFLVLVDHKQMLHNKYSYIPNINNYIYIKYIDNIYKIIINAQNEAQSTENVKG